MMRFRGMFSFDLVEINKMFLQCDSYFYNKIVFIRVDMFFGHLILNGVHVVASTR